MIRPGDALDAAARLGDRPGRVVLTSGSDADGLGRFDFVAAGPELTIEADGARVTVSDGAGRRVWAGEADPFDVLAERAGEAGALAAAGEGEGPAPVAVGYLGYDLCRLLEPSARWRPESPRFAPGLPDMWFGIYGAVWRADRETGESAIVGPDPRARARLARALARSPAAPSGPPELGPLRPAEGEGEAEYRRRFERVKEYIRAGDTYQINLARRLAAPVEAAGDPLALLAALARRAPAAYAALIDTGRGQVLSASPERFLARGAGSRRIETRPIKGTRRRVGDPGRDREAAEDLARDEKERAEHLMIVDLERNDLGRLAEIGSVRVDSFARVVELPTVLHLVSTVSADLRPGARAAEILRATFPSGSITGAPKVRAMEIIDELEPARRGPYTGAIGYLGAGGSIELSIGIRTAIVAGGAVHVHVGGGVVGDSRVDRELEETEAKAEAWRRALGAVAAEGGRAAEA